jgi:hypothetical protein
LKQKVTDYAENLTVLGIKIEDRIKEAGEVQKVLTKLAVLSKPD